jgi:hypothetical protein
MQSDLFVRSDTGQIVTQEYRDSVIKLLKLLYRLDIVSEKQVLDVFATFQSLFV